MQSLKVNCLASNPNPLCGCNSDLAQYSNTPSLRVAGFEDEDDDEGENEAPGEALRALGECTDRIHR
jgi:hypothetical protein